MRKALLCLFLAVPLSLGGCQSLSNISAALSVVNTTAKNPVTKTTLLKIESAANLVFIALNTYRDACIKGTADLPCRENIAAIQVYTVPMPPYIAQLRQFVKNNDQINASVVYNQLVQLYNNAKATAAQRGIPLGG
jgi:hypothetical protein